ncbi:MAG: ribonuclease Z, partial [Treponema sp.]|nr:ribonuclease Z [Treponema sp.]
IKEYIETSKKVLDMYINYPIIIKEIEAPCIVHSGKDYYIRAFPLEHTKTCVGYTLEELDRPGEFNPDKARELNVPCGPLWSQLQNGFEVNSSDGKIVKPEDVLGAKRSGRKFSYVTDTLFKRSIIDEVRGSDFLVCEGMFEEALKDQAKEKKQMTATQAATIAKEADVRRMCLIHYSPRYNDKDLHVLLEEAQKIYPKAELSHDRMNIDIPFID